MTISKFLSEFLSRDFTRSLSRVPSPRDYSRISLGALPVIISRFLPCFLPQVSSDIFFYCFEISQSKLSRFIPGLFQKFLLRFHPEFLVRNDSIPTVIPPEGCWQQLWGNRRHIERNHEKNLEQNSGEKKLCEALREISGRTPGVNSEGAISEEPLLELPEETLWRIPEEHLEKI